jgi:hypothetical protein
VAADRAHSPRADRAYLRRRRIAAVIPEKTGQQANRKTWRGLATRHGKAPDGDAASS